MRLLTLFMVIITVFSSAAGAENLVKNGGIEDGSLNYWASKQQFGGQNKLFAVTTEAKSKKQIIRSSGDPENKYNKFITLVQKLPVLDHDMEYVLSARVRSEIKSVEGKEFKIAVRQANDQDATLAYTGFNVKLDKDIWQYYELRFRPDPRATSFALYLIGRDLTREDAVFIDNIELYKAVNPGKEFVPESAVKEAECRLLRGEDMKARIDKSTGLLFSLEAYNQIIHPAAEDVSAVFVQANNKEHKLASGNQESPDIPFKAVVNYALNNNELAETVSIEATADAIGPFKLGVRHGFDKKQWRNIINALRPLRVINADQATIYSFLSDENDLNPGQLDQYQSVCYPLTIIENDKFFVMDGSYNLDNFVTLSPNMPSGYLPSLQRNPLSVKKGDIFKFEINWKVFPKSNYLLRDVWRYYNEHISTADPELAKFIPARQTEPRTFYPGCFGSSTYFQKDREDRLYPGSSVWFYSWHDNISERYPVKGSWWSAGNNWERKISADWLKQYVDQIQQRDIKLIFYFRQIANLNQKGKLFPENWYKKKAGGGLHLYGGGYSVKLPAHVASDAGYDSIAWGSYDFSNADYRKFYINECMEAINYYRPAAIGWDMGNDIHEFMVMAEIYELLKKAGIPAKVVANESAGPTQAYCDMALLENGLLGGKSAYDFEVAKAFTTAVVCLERWNLFRLAVETNISGKRTWLADKGLKENKKYLDYLMANKHEIRKDINELARLCQLRACLYDLALGASPGYLEEIKPVPAALVNMAGDVNGILKINKSFVVKLPNNNDVNENIAASAWADNKKLRIAVFNNNEQTQSLNLRLDKKYFQSLSWKFKDMSEANIFSVTPDSAQTASGIKIEETATDYILSGRLASFTALLLFANH